MTEVKMSELNKTLTLTFTVNRSTYIRPSSEGVDNPKTYRADCSVLALANMLGCTYQESFLKHKEVNRKDNEGTRITTIAHLYKANNLRITLYGNSKNTAWLKKCTGDGKELVKKGLTVQRFLAENPKGTYAVLISNHVFVIKEGKILDRHSVNALSRINAVWS